MKSLIILPSYNESGNIIDLIKAILALSANHYVCVVDDNSPDGTSPLVAKYCQQLSPEDKPRLHLITRQKKDGRGGAVREGLRWGIEQDHNFESLIEMDCDFSHDPKYLEEGLKRLKGVDFVIAARYPDGEIVGWPAKRKILSFCSNLLTRILISWGYHDYTNGYRFYSRQTAMALCEKPQKFKGYIYLSECLAFLIKKGFKGDNFPITFVNRQIGASNTTFKEVFSSLTAVFQIAWDYRFNK